MMEKIELKNKKLQHKPMAGLVQQLFVIRLLGSNICSVVPHCLLYVFFLLLFIPNISSAALPVVEILPSITAHLKRPSGVAVGDDGKIYIAEQNMNRVHVFSKSGQHQGSILGLDAPAAVAVDSAGQIYIGNIGRGDVEVYSPGFLLIGTLGAGGGEFHRPIGIAVDSAGLIYVVDGHESKVKIYNADRSFKSSFGSKGTGYGQFQLPTSIVINETTSEILIPDFAATIASARVQVFDLNGVFKRSFVTTGTNELGEAVSFLRPFGITVDALGRIYVSDGYQNVITVYDTQGNYLGKLHDSNHPLRNPLGVAFAAETDRLFIASLNTGSVETFGIDRLYGHIAVTPQMHNFGGVVVNNVSTTQHFNLFNDGSGDLVIGAVTLTGVDESEFFIVSDGCANTILMSSTGCVIDVQFKPLSTGSKSAFLSVISDDIYMPTLDVALSGNAEPQLHRLTLSKNGAGNGLVQAVGINCGATCIKEYADGTEVTLTALPSEGSRFMGWSGGVCMGTEVCTIIIGQPITIGATFDLNPIPPVTYSIAVNAGNNGSISPADTITANAGSTVTFDIAADANYHISNVLVDGASMGALSRYSFDNLDANHTIAAEFAVTNNLSFSSIEMHEVSVGHEWKRVNFNSVFNDPVVVVKPASLNDATPAVIRVRHVDAQGFDVRIQEWNYLNDLTGNGVAHADELVSYIVMERGRYALADGTQIEAGRFNIDASSSTFATINFAQAFKVSPIVISSVVTNNEDTPVIGQMNNIGITSFGYRLQEEYRSDQVHAAETVSFIAWEPSQGVQSGVSFEVGVIKDAQLQQTTAVKLNGNYTNQPLFIADLQTTNGGVVNLRWSDRTTTDVHLLIDQEQSANAARINIGLEPLPTVPSTEGLGYLVLWSVDLRPHTLTVEKSGLGGGQIQAQGIHCGLDCSEDYSDGAQVTLSAVAADGSIFVGWSGGDCRGTGHCTVTMDQAVTVNALFNKVHQLVVLKSGSGTGQVQAQGINCGADCSEDYSDGVSVVLSATVDIGSVFTGWSGGGCSGTSHCIVTMGQATMVTAMFNIAPDDDNDGLPDNYEEQYTFLNPYDASDAGSDQDGDGVTNLQEYRAGSDPTKEDTDRDGLSDRYELDNNLDPTDGICPTWVCGGSGGWRHVMRLLK